MRSLADSPDSGIVGLQGGVSQAVTCPDELGLGGGARQREAT